MGQGALGIECRADDIELLNLLSPLNHQPTRAAVTAERALLSALRAGCHAPVGIQTKVVEGTLKLSAVILAKDGSRYLFAQENGAMEHSQEVGQLLADTLIQYGAEKLLTKE